MIYRRPPGSGSANAGRITAAMQRRANMAIMRSHPRKPTPKPFQSKAKDILHQLELEADAANLPRPHFPFAARDVLRVYERCGGEAGFWFHLKDGRIFDRHGEQQMQGENYEEDDPTPTP